MSHLLRAATVLGIVILVAGLPGARADELCSTNFDPTGSLPGDGIINTYFPGTSASLAAGATSIPVGASAGAVTPIAAGDLLLVIQMQDADINTDNDGNYGDGEPIPGPPAADDIGSGFTAANNAGRYEYVVATGAVGSVTAGEVPIQGAGAGGGLLFSYRNEDYVAGTNGQRSYQVVRVPSYTALTVPAGGLSALRWGGTSGTLRCGGILAFDVRDELNLNGQTLNASGRGFRGGYAPRVQGETVLPVSPSDYRNMSIVGADPLGAHGVKGEGIAGTPRLIFDSTMGSPPLLDLGTAVEGYPFGCLARGGPANAGGGGSTSDPDSGSGVNAGGGGGGNGGPGGRGGRDGDNLNPGDPHRGGMGGSAFADAAGTALWGPGRVVMGGGGGSGGRHNNNPDASHGNSGGGIVLIRTGSVNAAAGTINADGLAAVPSNNDASGGGGAGGSVVLMTLTGDWSSVTVTARGGNGGNAGAGGSQESPGAGGGGGVILSNAAVNAGSSTAPGANGTTAVGAEDWDAESGIVGTPAPGDPANPFINPDDIPGADSSAECAQNSAPVITALALAVATEQDTPLTFAGGWLISVADSDAGASDIRIMLTVARADLSGDPPGTLTLASLAGLSFSVGDGTTDSTMTFDGTVAEINAALNGLQYDPPAAFIGPPDITLTINVNDLGNTGLGGARSDNETIAITVGITNDPPVNSVPGAQATPEDTPLIFSVANGNLISISDPDAGGASVQVALTVTNGTLTLSGIAGLTFSVGDGTDDAAMTFTGTMAAINAALAGMSYTPTANYFGPAQLSITTNDLGNTGAPGPKQDSDTVDILVDPGVNDPPVAADDAYTTFLSMTLNSSVGVLANDFDVDVGDTLTVAVLAGPTSASSFVLNPDGTFSYTPVPGFVGTDTFTYTVSDGNGGTDTATVSILVRWRQIADKLKAGYCGLTGLEGFVLLGALALLRSRRRARN